MISNVICKSDLSGDIWLQTHTTTTKLEIATLLTHCKGHSIGNMQQYSFIIIISYFRLYVYTRTDQSDSRRGYRIKYYTGCNVIINRPNGTIESPAYGVDKYPPNQVIMFVYTSIWYKYGISMNDFLQECVYRVLHPAGGRLSMRFEDLRLDSSDRVQVGIYPGLVWNAII